MKAKALSQFYTKLRYNDEKATLVSIGQVIEGDDDNMRALAHNRMVELIEKGTATKPAKPNAAPPRQTSDKPEKGEPVEGETTSEPLAGTGEGEQLPAPEGTETLPSAQTAPEDGKGKE